MAKVSRCPAPSSLKALLSGELPGADKEGLLQHVEECSSCAEKLGQAAGPDTLADLMRQAETLAGGPEEEAISRLIERLTHLPRGAAMNPPDETAGSAIVVTCPGCQKKLKVKETLRGKKVKCPQCGLAVPVPGTAVKAGEMSDLATLAPAAREETPREQTAAMSQVPAGPHDDDCDFLAPAQAADEIGRLGPYRVLKVLGKGGMGVVFQAEDPQLGRLVALKAMLPSLAASASARARFLREAKAAAAIKHDHIVTIHQVGEDRGAPFLAMEFLKGEPLDKRLERERSLPVAEVLRIGREVAEGLEAAHELGMIHRDIKPANIWLESRRVVSGGVVSGKAPASGHSPLTTHHSPSRVKILDFGLARAASDDSQLTQTGAVVGTPAFMAPEQAAGQPLDHRCDLFSLGCVLYRMCTGKLPFKGNDTISTLMAVAIENPPTPRQIDDKLPEALSALVMRLLAKKPEDRYQSAAEAVEALRAIEQDPASGGRQPPDDRTLPGTISRHQGADAPRSPSSRRKIAIIGGFAAAAIAAVFIFRLQTPQGEFIVEVADESVALAINKDGGLKVIDKQSGREYLVKARQTQALPAGEYELVVSDPKADLEFSTTKFSIKGKDTPARVSVWFKGKDPGLVKAGDDRAVAGWALSIGATIKMSVGDEIRELSKGTSLPKGPFLLVGLNFRAANVQPDDLARLANLKNLTEVDLHGLKISGKALPHLQALPQLKGLHLYGARVDDDDMKLLNPNLTHLELDYTKIGDAGLALLASRCPGLQSLALSGTKATDAGLEHVAGLKKLRDVSVSNNPAITDAGLEHLARLGMLRTIGIEKTGVTGSGFRHLVALPELHDLWLGGNPLEDSAFDYLPKLPHLGWLDLRETPTTDSQLLKLAGSKTLGTVIVKQTKVTAVGVHKLQTALPKLVIEADTAVEPAVKPPPLLVKDKPFLLIRKDGSKQEYKHFAEVLATLQDGDKIEVHGNGPFQVPQVGRGLDLRAAPGYRPLFVPLGRVKGNASNSWFIPGGDVRIEGCDFRWEGGDFLFQQVAGSLELRKCRFLSLGASLGGSNAANIRISDCLVLCGGLSSTAAKAEVELSNNVSWWGLGVHNGARVRLLNNTFANYGLTTTGLIADPIRVEARGNAFGMLVPYLEVAEQKGVQWQCEQNLYRVHADQQGKLLAAWKKLTGSEEKGSREISEVFMSFDRFRKSDAEKGIAMLRPIVEAMQKKHKLAELGPQWDLVGPGEAYVKALAAAGKKVAADQLRPSALASGAFVILRKDKEFQGYLTLQEALNAAEDGDTVEIRTDGPFPGAQVSVQGKQRALTIRSAPGYRPVVQGILKVHGKDRLVIEGLHFRKGAITNQSTEGHVVRIANCAFEDEFQTYLGFHAEKDQPAEIVRCWFPCNTSLTFGAGDQLRIRHSVFGMVTFDKNLDIERCAFVTPPGQYPLWNGANDSPAVSVKVSFLDFNHELVSGAFPRWTGAGNVYAAGHVGTLRSLQEKYKSPDTGSAEDFPLLWDPQEWRLQLDGKTAYGADVDKMAK